MIHKSFAEIPNILMYREKGCLWWSKVIDPTTGRVFPPVGQMSEACRGKNIAPKISPNSINVPVVWNDVMRKGQKAARPYPQKDVSQELQERQEQQKQHHPQYDMEKATKGEATTTEATTVTKVAATTTAKTAAKQQCAD